MSIFIRKPNIFSCVWILICLKIIMLNVSNRGIIDYLIWGISCVCFFIYQKRLLNSQIAIIGYPLWVLLFLQVVGLIQIFTIFSVTSIIATFCIYCFIMVNSQLNMEIQHTYIKISFVITFLCVVFYLYKGAEVGNTLPGCMIFLAYGFLISELTKDKAYYSSRKLNSIFYVVIIGIVYLCWIAEARTALFTIPIIVALYLFFPKKSQVAPILFWGLVIGCILVTLIYINIHSFSWYNMINNWSILKFGKQIDSSRPELWRIALNELEWWQIIIGAGTGKLPSIARYRIASFHNSYIQLLMQNGILGLSCLIMVFYRIWIKLSTHSNDVVVRLVLSTFVGIIIYNCFECTLLQNKAFLGIIEWLILCMGLIRVRLLERSSY